MKRDLEPVDLMVAVGVFATLLGAALLFMATSGPIQTATPEGAPVNRSPDNHGRDAVGAARAGQGDRGRLSSPK